MKTRKLKEEKEKEIYSELFKLSVEIEKSKKRRKQILLSLGTNYKPEKDLYLKKLTNETKEL